MSAATTEKERADLFRYAGLDVGEDTLRGAYELDGRRFVETVTFEGVPPVSTPAARALAELWYLLAGLSYYKAGAARSIDVGTTPLGTHGRALLAAALREGLAEFAYRNGLDLEDVEITGGGAVTPAPMRAEARRVLVPFGGGIDSVVTTNELAPGLERALFVVSPASGRVAPLEATADVTGLPVVRATRTLDAQILAGDPSLLRGHVPVTAMVTLLACVAAAADGRGGVAMSNEHSASIPNFRRGDLDVNHQWSKSWEAERLLAAAVAERVGPALEVASVLRDRSEVWVAREFADLAQYHHVFRSCNRAFAQAPDQRHAGWCGECDKCLFIDLMLAPFLVRADLRAIFGHEPLADPARVDQLRVLVGVGGGPKPFECVGDPDESAVALARVAAMDEWSDVAVLAALSEEVSPDRTFDELLEPLGPSRVPAHWLR